MSDKTGKESIPEEGRYIGGEEGGSIERKNGLGEDMKGGGDSRQELPVKNSSLHEKGSDKDSKSLEDQQQQQKKKNEKRNNINIEEDSVAESVPRVQSFLQQQQPQRQARGALSPSGRQAQRLPQQQQQRKQDIGINMPSTPPPVQPMQNPRQQPQNKPDNGTQKGVSIRPQQLQNKLEIGVQKGAGRPAQSMPPQPQKKQETGAQKAAIEPPNRPAQDTDAQKSTPVPPSRPAPDTSQQTRQKQELDAKKSTPAPPPADQHAQGKPSTPSTKPESVKEEKVELRNNLPALPPKPAEPQRKLNNNNVPEGNQDVKPQLNIPPGSDLGVVGKIGAYQMSQTQPTSSATHVHANVYFWVYALTLFVTLFIMKKQK